MRNENPMNFKQTEISSIPEDWEVLGFEDAITKKRIKVGKIKQKEYKRIGEYPVIDQSQNYIAGYTDEKDKLYQGVLPVIIFGDHTRIFKFVDFPFVTGADGVKVILTDNSKFDSKFFYYAMLELKIESRGYNRHYPLLREKKISHPPILEQQKIARVLGKIQQATEQQDKIIEATKNLKKSLMQKLFTEGIGRTEFKETEIGQIPKNWEVVRLGNVGDFQYGYTASAKEKPVGPKFLRITDIKSEARIFWGEVPYCTIKENELSKYKLVDGDILVARIGATTGKTCIIKNSPEAVFASYLIRFQVKRSDDALPLFLYYFTNSPIYWDQINANKEGKLKKGVSASFLKVLRIPLPSLPEQQQIAHILSTVDKKIEAEEKRKATPKELFKTMLNKLMTGEIRLKEIEL